MKITKYTLKSRVKENIKFAVVSDLHGYPHTPVLDAIKEIEPNAVLIPGDVFHDDDNYKSGIELLEKCAKIYPTFVSIGNHEFKISSDPVALLKETGATVLDNEHTEFMDVMIGGLTSGYTKDKKQTHFGATPPPDTEWLKAFSKIEGYKVLLCHHPEYYPAYIRDKNIDLILSGHAHGGQWRFFGRGLFAPGQGIFPKYTYGMYEGKLIVSRGVGNPHFIPRINNKPEIILLMIEKEEKQ
jgi:predicted MPP superfamily phosphohydrolase